jgi:hypothetical protein
LTMPAMASSRLAVFCLVALFLSSMVLRGEKGGEAPYKLRRADA